MTYCGLVRVCGRDVPACASALQCGILACRPPLPVACPLATATACARPTGWCNESTKTYTALDCDGDGLMDQACGDFWNHRWVILSSQGCADDSGGAAIVSECPAFFNSEHWDGGRGDAALRETAACNSLTVIHARFMSANRKGLWLGGISSVLPPP